MVRSKVLSKAKSMISAKNLSLNNLINKTISKTNNNHRSTHRTKSLRHRTINFYSRFLFCKKNLSKQSPGNSNSNFKVEGTRQSSRNESSTPRLDIVRVIMRKRLRWRQANTVSMMYLAPPHSREEHNTLSSSSNEACHNLLDCKFTSLKFISLYFFNVVLDFIFLSIIESYSKANFNL